MDALKTYLRETRTSPAAFAKLIGLDAEHFERLLAGETPINPCVAQRMVDATGGALLLEDLTVEDECASAMIDLRGRFAAEAADIDVERLAEILSRLLPALIGGARRMGDEHLPKLAAEAAANTYAALSTVTTRRGPDRLIQALRPVFLEILEELAAPARTRRRLQETIEKAAELYVQARPRRRA